MRTPPPKNTELTTKDGLQVAAWPTPDKLTKKTAWFAVAYVDSADKKWYVRSIANPIKIGILAFISHKGMLNYLESPLEDLTFEKVKITNVSKSALSVVPTYT